MEPEFLIVDYSKCDDRGKTYHDAELHYVGLDVLWNWLNKAWENPEKVKIAVHRLTLVIDWS